MILPEHKHSDVAGARRLHRRLGASFLGQERCHFLVWAPHARQVELHLTHPIDRLLPLEAAADGYFRGVVDGIAPGARYYFRLNGEVERPDPASRCQPEGVHGPSQVVDDAYPWTDQGWVGLPLAQYILYELHVGTFTEAGTFEAVIPRLDGLVELGVTAVEIMPVHQFPGTRNWGYDGAYLFAVQESYGGAEGLRKLVDACHRRGMAVALDVVYNHLGPEGNYLSDFGPYFTDRYRTPWGSAVNFDGAGSDHVRRFFFDNAVSWIRDFHIDMLRLDAVHAIFDHSARPVLRELAAAVHAEAQRLGRRVYVVSETTQNDPRHVSPPALGGYGHDALWNDDFHHALHALLTGERKGYYADFGSLEDLGRAYRDGFALTGNYSHYRGRRHGASSRAVPATCFVVYAQNHDQVGNRLASERLSRLVSFEQLKLAAALVLLSPYVPMVFMGEEYGETVPFPFFTDHGDARLNEAVWRGRQEEFTRFAWEGQIPAPHEEATFHAARLDRHAHDQPQHQELYRWYGELIRLRKSIPALACLSKEQMEVGVNEAQQALTCRRWHEESEICAVYHFAGHPATVHVPLPPGTWRPLLRSEEGNGESEAIHSAGEASLEMAPASVVLFQREES